MAGLDLARRYTPEEYLAYERQAPNKHEYIAGKIIPMADADDEPNLARQIVVTRGAGRRHNLITGNLLWVLMSQLREQVGEIYTRQEYVLVAQDQPLVEQFVREGERWVLIATTDPAAVLQLSSIGCELPVAEVYRKVVFAADTEQGDSDPAAE